MSRIINMSDAATIFVKKDNIELWLSLASDVT